jgi:hypothetical protein
MIELSPLTRRHVAAMFDPAQAEQVEELLARECAENLPLMAGPPTPESLERIRFAALRLSGGNTEHLRQAVRLAQIDWRDLLIAAGFADDVQAHARWQP